MAISPEMGIDDALYYAALLRSINMEEAALNAYAMILKKDPHCVEALIARGVCLQILHFADPDDDFLEAVKVEGRLSQSAELYRRSIQLDPLNWFAADCLDIVSKDLESCLKFSGSARDRIQQHILWRLSRDSFVEALRLDPCNVSGLTHWGILLKDEGRLVEAIEMLQKALKIDPINRLASECLSICYTDIGTCSKLGGSAHKSPVPHYLRQNLWKLSNERFIEALGSGQENACALTHCGILYKCKGQLHEAAEMFRRAIKCDPLYKPAEDCLLNLEIRSESKTLGEDYPSSPDEWEMTVGRKKNRRHRAEKKPARFNQDKRSDFGDGSDMYYPSGV